MFEQTFKNIDDIFSKDSGADSELDYIGQTSWGLFLRYQDDLEVIKVDEAGLKGEEYNYILSEEFRRQNRAMPKGEDVKTDHHVAMTGPDLVQFVDGKLFSYLHHLELTKIRDLTMTENFELAKKQKRFA